MLREQADIVNDLIHANYPFALFRAPGEASIELVLQKTKELEGFMDLSQVQDKKGFLLAPFTASCESPFMLIRPDVHQQGLQGLETLTNGSDQENKPPPAADDPKQFSREDYLMVLDKLIDLIKMGEMTKVIISRTVLTALHESFSPGDFFLKMKENLKDSFIYLVNLPGKALWTGASPEVLMFKDNTEYETVAMAGTAPAHAQAWSDKEYDEQALVSGYIEHTLEENGIEEYLRTGPFSVAFGPVAHLKTKYTFSAQGQDGWLIQLIKDLHPTPAVGGIPKDKAISFILRHEPHNREYYTGYLGKWNLQSKTQLFVNLRCMKIQESYATLFSGGGITRGSNPEKEWEETSLKARTLLSLLKK